MVSSELLKKYNFQEEIEECPYSAEVGKGAFYRKTGYPKPQKRFKIIWEVYDLSVEEPYYWMHNYLEQDLGFPHIIKTEDVFAAAENSAFFGVSQQRLGAQQDRISQYLATIGKMVKELFQLVRELRIIDERLTYYNEVIAQLRKPLDKRNRSAEITLKGIFIDLVQGGSKNPASVYGMARELEFTVLPDVFFDAPPMTHDEVESHVERLDFNKKLLEVLKRHLYQYIIWRERTDNEMRTRRTFTLQYLKQHFEIIRMYMNWVKPYLRHTQRLAMKGGFESEPEIVSAFESSMIDVEMFGFRPWKRYNTVIMVTFHFRTRPSLKFVQEGYQRGPVHVGKMELFIRGYVWTREQIENYVKMKKEEDFELMKSISHSVEAAMESLGGELRKYLEEASTLWDEKGKKKEEHGEGHEDHTNGHGSESLFRRMFHDFLPEKKVSHKEEPPKHEEEIDSFEDDKQKSEAKKDLQNRIFLSFKNFKKGHGMIMW